MACAALLCAGSRNICGQTSDTDEHKLEIGAQLSLLNISTVRGVSTTPVPCLVPPCPVAVGFERSRETEPGFGGRIGYNFTDYLAVEAEVNYFPRERRFDHGQAVELLTGVKVGRRFEKVGVFGKARPGFLNARMSDFRLIPGTACIAVFPPPAGCFEEIKRRETNFAFDIGGVIELYPTRRTLVRFDAGDTIIRFGERNLIAPSPVFPGGVIVRAPAATTHNLQGSVGIGFRF